MRTSIWLVLLATALLVPALGLAAGGEKKDEGPFTAKEDVSVTGHQCVIGGETVAYTATAGYLELPSYEGKRRASIFFVAYVKKEVRDPAKRPLTFSFNGGPGSSSVWLHLGALGPRRVKMDDEGMPLPPPYRLVDNPHSILDLSDVVFVDPVSTGYSRAAKGVNPKEFHGLKSDVESMGEFIRLYVTKNERWASPKFLIGESYGTTRAAELSGHLQDRHGMNLNGIILVSPVLNFLTTSFQAGNDLAYWLYLPSYTATAWFHKRLPEGDLGTWMKEAEEFARGDYLLALAKGDELAPERRKEIAKRLARLTGLTPEFVLASNLRVGLSAFRKELLRAGRRSVGRLDSRYKGIEKEAAGSHPASDPSMSAIEGPYTATLNDYLRRELEYENDLEYEILTGRVHPWKFDRDGRFVNVAETLRRAMSSNRDLHVLYLSGYYDLATPYFAMDYTVAHLGLDPSVRKNIRGAYYEAGHMMYVRLASLRKMKADLGLFFGRALAGR
ncbi:MAG: S10 family peptidase [Planctomycetota bacterium]|jgi:carboxypeptidase C (cathepsin A)